jgi:methyl-accepting chemotaxis protein
MLRRQSSEIARAMTEQARAGKEMTTTAHDASKQIVLITRANLEHSTASDMILGQLNEVQKVSDQNTEGVKSTRKGVGNLRDLARTLGDILGRLR